jgi:hypothetical protein
MLACAGREGCATLLVSPVFGVHIRFVLARMSIRNRLEAPGSQSELDSRTLIAVS